MNDRILVTGATGFLGNALVRRLLADRRAVTVLHRDTPASVQSLDALRSAGAEILLFSSHDEIAALTAQTAPEAVFHLATKYVRGHRSAELDQMIEANIAFGTHLLESLLDSNATIVTAMSFFQFAAGHSEPYSVYSATKQAFAEISRFYREVRGLDIREVVLYDTFGPGDTRDKLIPRMVESLRDETPMTMGPSRQLLNLLFVDDVVSGLLHAAAPNNSSRMTVRAEQTTSVAALVGALDAASGRRLDASFADERETNDLVIRSGNWPTPDGWKPVRSLEDGLAVTWRSATA